MCIRDRSTWEINSKKDKSGNSIKKELENELTMLSNKESELSIKKQELVTLKNQMKNELNELRRENIRLREKPRDNTNNINEYQKSSYPQELNQLEDSIMTLNTLFLTSKEALSNEDNSLKSRNSDLYDILEKRLKNAEDLMEKRLNQSTKPKISKPQSRFLVENRIKTELDNFSSTFNNQLKDLQDEYRQTLKNQEGIEKQIRRDLNLLPPKERYASDTQKQNDRIESNLDSIQLDLEQKLSALRQKIETLNKMIPEKPKSLITPNAGSQVKLAFSPRDSLLQLQSAKKQSEKSFDGKEEDLVYVNENDTKYHKEYCNAAPSYTFPITRSDAEGFNLLACDVCRP
eukprot:TRINITY_DN11953_c0_g1_i1.p1 TRINITY_DN11953_c0_g1~~TRINITY_DN11953_c0_g1_i1.p1  ORF type:complete len:367 (+),score=54.39 TRINITY_DN11953_c0_g1_i1:64-1101(+)